MKRNAVPCCVLVNIVCVYVCVCFCTFSGQKCPDFVGKPEKNRGTGCQGQQHMSDFAKCP